MALGILNRILKAERQWANSSKILEKKNLFFFFSCIKHKLYFGRSKRRNVEEAAVKHAEEEDIIKCASEVQGMCRRK